MNAIDNGGTPNGFIYDIRTGVKLYDMGGVGHVVGIVGVKLYDMIFPYSLIGKQYYPPHAIQVSFGNQFYIFDSDFHMLYVLQVNGGNGWNDIKEERGVLVYDLKKNWGWHI